MSEKEGRVLAPFESPLRFIILSTLTFGAYQWYWGWRAWAMLRAVRGSKLNATLWAGFLGFTGFGLAKGIDKAQKPRGWSLYYSAGLYLGVSLILATAIGLLKLKGWPLVGGYLTLGLVEGLVLLPLHQALARMWRSNPTLADDPGLAPNLTLVGAIALIMYFSLANVLELTH